MARISSSNGVTISIEFLVVFILETHVCKSRRIKNHYACVTVVASGTKIGKTLPNVGNERKMSTCSRIYICT